MTKRINGTKSSTNKAGFKRVILALVVLLLSATLMVGAVSAVEAVEEQNEPVAQTTWYVNASVAESGVGTSAETAFKTMGEAVAEAVEDGGTIELLSDLTDAVTITTEKEVTITINGNGKNITVASVAGLTLNGASLSVVLNDLNVKVTGPGSGTIPAFYVNRNSASIKSLEINNGSYLNTNEKTAGAGSISARVTDSVKIHNAEIEGAVQIFGTSNIDIVGNTISYPENWNSNGQVAGFWFAPSPNLDAEEAKVLCEQIATENTFNFKENEFGWYVHITDPNDSSLWPNLRGLGTSGYAEAELHGLQYQYLFGVDKISALQYAQGDDTVYLLKDVTLANPLTINKAITLDGNGHKLTVPVLQITSPDVTIKNITVERASIGSNFETVSVKAGSGDAVEILESTIIAGKGTNSWSIALGLWGSNVTVTNCIIQGESTDTGIYIQPEIPSKYLINDNIITGTWHLQLEQYSSLISADIFGNFYADASDSTKGVAPNLGITSETNPDKVPIELDLVGANVYYTALNADGSIDTTSLISKVEPETQTALTMNGGTTETAFTITDSSSAGESTITFDNNKPTEMTIDYGAVDVTIETTTHITQVTGTGTQTYVIPAGATITATYPAETYVAPSPENTAAGTMTYDLEIGLNTVVKDLPVITSTFDSAVVNAVDDANEHVDVFGMINGEYPQGSTSNDNVTQVIITFKIPVGWKDGANINKFVVYHCDGVKAVPCTISERNTIGGFYVITVIGNGFSSYAIGYDTYVAPQSSGSPSSSTGTSEWLTETPTQQPTEQPTATQTPTDTVPTDVPTTSKPTEEPSSPGFGILAALAGLGAVAVLRRK